MDEASQLLMEVWESMKRYLPSSAVNDAAEALIQCFLSCGIQLDDLLEAGDEDPVLDRILTELRAVEEEDEEDEEEGRGDPHY